MSEQAWRKALDRELVRSGLVLDDSAVLEAMEHVSEEGYRFLPLKVSKSTGAITGDALASAERLGRLGRMRTILRYGFTKNTFLRTLGQMLMIGD